MQNIQIDLIVPIVNILIKFVPLKIFYERFE